MGKSFEFIGDSDLDVRFIIGSWTYLLLLHISSIVCLFSHYNLIFMHFISSSLCRMMYDCQRCLLIYIERQCMHSEFISFSFLFEIVCVLNFFHFLFICQISDYFLGPLHYFSFSSKKKNTCLSSAFLHSFYLFLLPFFIILHFRSRISPFFLFFCYDFEIYVCHFFFLLYFFFSFHFLNFLSSDHSFSLIFLAFVYKYI